MGGRVRFWLHLAVIAVASLVCGWWLYQHAHAADFRTFGDFRRSRDYTDFGLLSGPSGGWGQPQLKNRRYISVEFDAIFDAVPVDSPMRQCPGIPNAWNEGCHITNHGMQNYFFVMFCNDRAYFRIQQNYNKRWVLGSRNGDCYELDYGPAATARLRTVFDRLNAPQPK